MLFGKNAANLFRKVRTIVSRGKHFNSIKKGYKYKIVLFVFNYIVIMIVKIALPLTTKSESEQYALSFPIKKHHLHSSSSILNDFRIFVIAVIIMRSVPLLSMKEVHAPTASALLGNQPTVLTGIQFLSVNRELGKGF